MHRKGFTFIEVLVVLGILGTLSTLSIPFYWNYQVRNDLNLTLEQVTQALHRAQVLSQAGERDSTWGVSVSNGVLFKGMSFAARDPAFDEAYAFPSSISVSGLQEVIFSKGEGKPSSTGTIVLQALNGDIGSIEITVKSEGIIVNESDKLVICHKESQTTKKTLCIPEAAWKGHKKHGDTLGPCTGQSGTCHHDDDDD